MRRIESTSSKYKSWCYFDWNCYMCRHNNSLYFEKSPPPAVETFSDSNGKNSVSSLIEESKVVIVPSTISIKTNKWVKYTYTVHLQNENIT